MSGMSKPARTSPCTVMTITGPSGSGKTHLSKLLAARDPRCRIIVSTTTRAPRPGEQDGVDYHFITTHDLQTALRQGEMIEHVQVDGHAYGLRAIDVTDAIAVRPDGVGVVVVDPHGAAQVHAYCQTHGWNHVGVFLDNPLSVLMERLLLRYDDVMAAAGPDPAARAAARAVQARRLAALAVVERDTWIAPAHHPDQDIYRVVFDAYTPDNQDAVVKRTLALLDAPVPLPHHRAAAASSRSRGSAAGP